MKTMMEALFCINYAAGTCYFLAAIVSDIKNEAAATNSRLLWCCAFLGLSIIAKLH